MLVNSYGQDPSNAPERRYSPAVCVGAEKQAVTGNPDKKHISTSYVERQNLNIRIPDSPWIINAIAVILTFSLFYIVGLVGSYVLTKKLLYKLEALIFWIPLVKPIYGTMKKMVSLFTDSSEQLYQKVVVVRFPDEKTRMIGFITGQTTLDKEEKYVNVFVPTSPNPTTGFLLFIKNSDIVEVSVSVKEAMKLIISGGMMDAVKKMDADLKPEKLSG